MGDLYHMNDESLFCSLSSGDIASAIYACKYSICYAAPGIQTKPAEAIIEMARRIGPELITVCLDFDERVLRMGFGELEAVEKLRAANISVKSVSGLRTGLVIVDHQGFIFTPTALYLEAERPSDDAFNAMRLSTDQVTEALARLSSEAKTIAIALAKTEQERDRIRERAVEVPSTPVNESDVEEIVSKFKEAPPVPFDVVRQVRVYSAYLQYVNLSLTGAAIQRRRIPIPSSIQKLGNTAGLEGRLKTTFDLIERDSQLSSRVLGDRLNEIRKNFTPSLGKKYDSDRVVLKSVKEALEKRITEIKGDLEKHKNNIKDKLTNQLDQSRKEIVDYYTSIVLHDPPEALVGQGFSSESDQNKSVMVKDWLNVELQSVFPSADDLIRDMQIEVGYKDVTIETLRDKDFIHAVKRAFPHKSKEWDRVHRESLAARENV